jgi:tetratricopeptide (TPR) repeat protein
MRTAGVLLGMAVLGLAVSGVAQSQSARVASLASEIRKYEVLLEQRPDANNGGGWWKLAMLYQDAARFGDAERAYGKALELMKSGDPVALANVMDCMGTMYVQMGRYADAERLERKALDIRKEQKDSLGVGLSWMHLAMLSMGKHESADGEMYAELTVERLVPEKDENGATGEQKMTSLTYLALARCAAHECKDAMAPLKTAMTIAEVSYSEKSFPVSYLRFLEGYVDWKRGDDRTAAKLMKSGTEGIEAQLGWGHPTFVSAMRQYEGFLVATRRTAEATEVHEKMTRFTGEQTMAQSGSAVPALELPR